MDPGGPETIAADLADALRRLEELASGDPTDRTLAASILAITDRIAADSAFPPVVGGVRREALIRWDGFSATFTGVSVANGGPTMIRALRPEASRDPVFRRYFSREAQALAGVAPVQAEAEVLRLPLRGLPLSAVRGDGLARALSTGIAAIGVWHDAGLGIPAPAAEELRIEDGRVSVACLTAVEPDPGPALEALARELLHAEDDGPIAVAARAIRDHAVGRRGADAPTSPGAAADAVRRAMAEALTSQRHVLASRWRTELHQSRHDRLHAAVSRLERAVPAPEGGGAVGVDLDGRITVVEVRPSTAGSPGAVLWGPEGATEVVADGDGVRAAVARRMLRAHAASPSNAALQGRVGGDGERVDAICRWLSAGLKLRTVRLLLEKEP